MTPTEQSETVTLPSGAVLGIQMAPFATGMNLFKTVCRELKAAGVELDLTALGEKDMSALLTPVLQIAGSDAVERCIWDCLKRCTYNNRRITPETFETMPARGDWLKVAWEALRANLAPFFASLDWQSLIAPTGAASSPGP
jgi:hypothetical protein